MKWSRNNILCWFFLQNIWCILARRRVKNTFTNPIISSIISTDSPDPSVTRLSNGSGWVAVTTSNQASRFNRMPAFPIYFSPDLVTWTHVSWVFTPGHWPVWVSRHMWSPELHNVNGQYVVFFAAEHKQGKLRCGAALANNNDPFGTYSDIGKPLVNGDGSFVGAIDPHYFKDPVTNKDFLLWKQDEPFQLTPSRIYLQELNGLSLKGRPTSLLTNFFLIDDLIAEGPWMMFRDGKYYLFFSSGWFSSPEYRMLVAVSDSITGPFIRGPDPVIATDWKRYNKVNYKFHKSQLIYLPIRV